MRAICKAGDPGQIAPAAPHQRRRDGWWYDPGTNTIEFDGFAVPPPGSQIDVTYTEWFGPLQEQSEDEEESEE